MIFLVLRAGAKSVAHATVRPATKKGWRPLLQHGVKHLGREQVHPPIPAAAATAAGPFTGPMPVKTSTAYHIFKRQGRDCGEPLLILAPFLSVPLRPMCFSSSNCRSAVGGRSDRPPDGDPPSLPLRTVHLSDPKEVGRTVSVSRKGLETEP